MAVLDMLKQLLGGGDPEAEGAAQASTAMQPAIEDWYGRGGLAGMMGMQPGGVEDLAMGFGVGGLRGVRGTPLGPLYHGAARPFAPEPGAPLGRMRIDKALSGEGYHGEGFGGYASEVPEIGKYYKELYGEHPPEVVAKAEDYLRKVDPVNFERLSRNPNVNPSPKYLVQWANRLGADLPADSGGALYQLEYPGAVREQFLQWDEPLYAQSDYLKSALRKLGLDEDKPIGRGWDKLLHEYKPAEWTGSDIYEAVADRYGAPPFGTKTGDKTAADVLRMQGVRGTQYPVGEQGLSPGKSNYSVFSPEAMAVMRRLAGFLPPGVALGGGLLAADQQ